MANSITIDLDEALIRRFAEALAEAQGLKAVADSGIARKSTSQTSQADPWADDAPSDDDWPADSPATGTATQGRQNAPAQRAPAQKAGSVIVDTPKGRQRWTLGAANAPACLCSPPEPAAYVEGKSANGRGWKRWTCALGADSNSWQNKCDFSQWA